MKEMSSWLNRNSFEIRDEYYTPKILVEPILKYIKPNSTIWCPFDTADSEFVILFTEAGHKVIYTHIWKGEDFFELEVPDCDYIISNPPFTKKLEVLTRLFDTGKPFAILIGIPILNYQNICDFLFDKDWQLLLVNKKVSFDGNPSSFNTSYLTHKILSRNIIAKIDNTNAKQHYVPSRMYKAEEEV